MSAEPAPSAAPSFAAATGKKPQDEAGPISTVQVDGLALLKIQKHVKENAPAVVSGQLLGLDVGSTLEVTNCFPIPTRSEEDEAAEGASYQLDMMRCLRDINVDNNAVGWYQSTFKGTYQTVEMVETFMAYAQSIKRCICVLYDPDNDAEGIRGFKAIKLTDTFMAMYKDRHLSAEKVLASGFSWNQIFQEVPLTVHNSLLATAFMTTLSNEALLDQGDFDRLGKASNATLTQSLSHVMDCVDEQQWELTKLSRHQREAGRNQQLSQAWLQDRRQLNNSRRANGEEPLSEEIPAEFKTEEPNNVEGLLLANQMQGYCQTLQAMASASLIKGAILGGGL